MTVRRAIAIGVAAAVVWSAWRAGLDRIVNTAGWPSFARFWSAVAEPALDRDFVTLTVDAAVITAAYAILGTALSLVIGVVAALALSDLLFPSGALPRLVRLLLVVPRAVHEVVWALLLIQILGFDPLVPVLAIGLPFGAVTAKVFAETIDEADRGPYLVLRASGARRLTALAYGVLPSIRGELLSYGFYRFECSVRSAAVLGVVGAGGLGFQLDLSFESLRYREIWTLILALMVLSGAVEAWSSIVRRSRHPRAGQVSLGLVLALVPLSWLWVGLDPRRLWSARSRDLGADLAGRLVPPRAGPEGWGELVLASVDTAAMSVLALLVAIVGALVLGPLAARPVGPAVVRSRAAAAARWSARIVAAAALLLFRAVPAPVWAFLAVLVLFPGLWPGAVALGVATLGVLGRLFAEAIEDRDHRPATALRTLGAGSVTTFFYGTLPAASARLVALALYRWEVVVRETVVVGVVGAGGIGQLINDHLAARDFAAVTGAVLGLLVVTAAIDAVSRRLRRELRVS
ncbi:MAG: ABC transporter permease subunit [Actinomycetota bacterium]